MLNFDETIKHCIVCGKELPKRRLKEGKNTCCRKCSFSTDDYRAKLSAAQKERYKLKEARLVTSLSIKKAYENPEVRQRLSLAHKELGKQLEYKQKLSKSLKDATSTEEYKQKRSIIAKEIWQRKEYRQYRSDLSKTLWTNANYRDKVMSSTKATLSKQEIRQKLSTAQKEAQNRPEVKQKKSKSSQTTWLAHKDKILEKRYSTYKQNNSFNFSKPEQDTKRLLKLKFNDIQHQYRSKEYPFNCDFYIPSLDLYIELNFHWTHGGRAFDENDESCIEQLHRWQEKAKTSKFYKNAIETWTIRDTKKRQCAIDNKLNWLSFYSRNDFDKWVNALIVQEGNL